LSWIAGRPEAALKDIRRIVAESMRIMKADGDPIPDFLSNKKYSGKFLCGVPPPKSLDLAIQVAEAGIKKVSVNPL